MHDQHQFSAQAFASMAWELNRHTRPVDGEDATTSVGDGASVLSRCSSFASMPSLEEVATGGVHDEPECKGNECSDGVWEDITRGDGDTTRGDGDAEDTGEPTRRGHDGHLAVLGANMARYWGHAYLEEQLGRAYIDITHGGGATTVAQTNDSDHHQNIRKRFLELETELMLLDYFNAGKTSALTRLMEEEKQPD